MKISEWITQYLIKRRIRRHNARAVQYALDASTLRAASYDCDRNSSAEFIAANALKRNNKIKL